MTDLIILEDNDLDDIFDIVNAFQIVFHPYYAKEGKFINYKDFLRNQKDKIIVLDRNMASMLFDYFKNGELKDETNMIMLLSFLMFCNYNRLQYNIGLAMNEYGDSKENAEVIKQLNELLTYLSEIPSLLFLNRLKSGDYKFPKFEMVVTFQRHANYKNKSIMYLVSYCSVLKVVEIFLSDLSAKDKIIKYLDWYYDNLKLSMYDITYAILLFTNYESIKAPKNIKSKDIEKVIKGCKNQAWDISYLSSINNFKHHFPDKEIFFATNDKNLKIIFMGCHYFEDSWYGMIYDRITNKKDKNEIFELIEDKMSNRLDFNCDESYLIKLASNLEKELKKKIINN